MNLVYLIFKKINFSFVIKCHMDLELVSQIYYQLVYCLYVKANINQLNKERKQRKGLYLLTNELRSTVMPISSKKIGYLFIFIHKSNSK